MSGHHGRPRPPYEPVPIRCPQCGFSQTVPTDTARQGHCQSCDSTLALDDGEARVLGHAPPAPEFRFQIGQTFAHRGLPYEIAARIAWATDDDDPHEFCHEYLLWSRDRAALWLNHQHDGFALWTPTHAGPVDEDLHQAAGDSMQHASGERLRCVEAGVLRCTYVDGALPWRLSVGARRPYQEYRGKGGSRFEVVVDGDDLDFGEGLELSEADVLRAFGTDVADGVVTDGTGANGLDVAALWLAAAGAPLLLAFVLWPGPTEQLAAVADWPESPECTVLGNVDVESHGTVVRSDAGAPLDQQWLALDLRFEDNTQIVYQRALMLERWSGYEGGEHWVEDHSRRSAKVRGIPPGRYDVRVCGESGAEGRTDPKPMAPATVRIATGGRDAVPLGVGGAVAFGAAALALLLRIWGKDAEGEPLRPGPWVGTMGRVAAIAVAAMAVLCFAFQSHVPTPPTAGDTRENSSGVRRSYIGGGTDWGK